MELLSNKFDPGTSIYLACNSQMSQGHAVFVGHHFRPSQAAVAIWYVPTSKTLRGDSRPCM